MCDVCMRFPCDNRCPNAPQDERFVYCNYCNGKIYVGEEAWSSDDGEIYCSEECLDEAIGKHTLIIKGEMLEW